MNLHFQAYGEGPPLIILHGLFGMLDNWHTVSRKLAMHFHVFAVDQRNHGRSPHSTDFNYQVLSDDVRDFIAQHRLTKVSLLGHSMGGKTAMWTALKYPDIVDRLIVIDIAPREYPSHHDNILDALESVDFRTVSSRNDVDTALSSHIPEFAVRQFLMKNLARSEDGTYHWKMNLPVLVAHYEDMMKGVDSDGTYARPTLFVRGTRSSYIADADRAGIKRLFPEATTVDFDTGHWVHAEAPDQLVQTVTAFLNARRTVP